MDEPLPWKEIPETPPFPTTPCENNCFLNIPGISAKLQGISAAGNSQLVAWRHSMEVIEKPTEEDWTASDKTMFRVLSKTFPTDFCTVAKALRTKECRQVINRYHSKIGEAYSFRCTTFPFKKI